MESSIPAVRRRAPGTDLDPGAVTGSAGSPGSRSRCRCPRSPAPWRQPRCARKGCPVAIAGSAVADARLHTGHVLGGGPLPCVKFGVAAREPNDRCLRRMRCTGLARQSDSAGGKLHSPQFLPDLVLAPSHRTWGPKEQFQRCAAGGHPVAEPGSGDDDGRGPEFRQGAGCIAPCPSPRP